MIANLAVYEQTKVVEGGKITSIQPREPWETTQRVRYLDKDNQRAWVDLAADWMDKHKPEVGWYLVQYKDGYLSASPPGPFEEAAIRIDQS